MKTQSGSAPVVLLAQVTSELVRLFPKKARLSQSVEHQTFNLRVMGTNPISGEFVLSCLLTFQALHRRKKYYCKSTTLFCTQSPEIQITAMLVYTTKECDNSSIVLVHQYGGYDVICKPIMYCENSNVLEGGETTSHKAVFALW